MKWLNKEVILMALFEYSTLKSLHLFIGLRYIVHVSNMKTCHVQTCANVHLSLLFMFGTHEICIFIGSKCLSTKL